MTGMRTLHPGACVAGCAAALALALGGCTSGPAPSPSTAPVSPGVDGTPAPAPPTTPVPAPGGGDVGTTVTATQAPEPLAQEIGQTAEVTPGVRVDITDVSAITASSTGPGEVAGPAVAVTVGVVNDTDAVFDLARVSVNLTDSEGLPGSGMTGEPARWLTGSLEPGASAEGIYVFTVAEDHRDPVHVEVSVDPTLPTVVFTGEAD